MMSPIYQAKKIYAGQEFVFLVGKDAKNLGEILPVLAESGAVLCVGSLFGKVDTNNVDGFYFGDLGSVNKVKEQVLDLHRSVNFYSSVPQARAYPGWKVFAGRVRGLTFDAGRLCKNGGEHGALFNLGAILGAKTLVLIGFDLLGKKDAVQAEIITQLAQWAAHYKIEVISTDLDTAIEAYEYRPLLDFVSMPEVTQIQEQQPFDNDDEQPD